MRHVACGTVVTWEAKQSLVWLGLLVVGHSNSAYELVIILGDSSRETGCRSQNTEYRVQSTEDRGQAGHKAEHCLFAVGCWLLLPVDL